jgi:acetyl esterase/lipase
MITGEADVLRDEGEAYANSATQASSSLQSATRESSTTS